MQSYNPKQKLVFQHLHKCGGNSLIPVFRQWFGKGLYIHQINWQNPSPEGKPQKIEEDVRVERQGFLGLGKKKYPVCIFGHFSQDYPYPINIEDYYPGHRNMLTMLRNPLEAHISAYFFRRKRILEGRAYWEGKQLSLDDWFQSIDEYFEYYPTLFRFEHLPDRIWEGDFKKNFAERFIHVGVTEKIERSTNIMADKLGKPRVEVPHYNISERDQELSPQIRDKWVDRNKQWFRIWEWAMELNT